MFCIALGSLLVVLTESALQQTLVPGDVQDKEDELEKMMAKSPLTKNLFRPNDRPILHKMEAKLENEVDNIMKSAQVESNAKKEKRASYKPMMTKDGLRSFNDIVRSAKEARVAKPATKAKVALAGCGALVPLNTLGVNRQKALSLVSESITTTTKGAPFEVIDGPCKLEGTCWVSKNFGSGNYNRNDKCRVKFTGDRPLEVESFDLEQGWDYLYIDGVGYTGRGVDVGPNGVLPKQNSIMEFYSDFIITRTGFKICVPPPAEHSGANSFALPGVGAVQAVAEGGATGTVGDEEIFVKVLKDGFSDVGCYSDAMLDFGDKYGVNKDQYGRGALNANVSIVMYSALVSKEDQQPMTPRLCFEFCRTIQGMVFFGIRNGDQCYCEPYYKPQAVDGSKCDVPCVGDPTQLCGNEKKSTIWEMHLCADTAEDIKKAVISGTEALGFFHESAALSSLIAHKMAAAGGALEKVAGLSGSPSSGDLGMKAKQAGSVLAKAFIPGRKMYGALYESTKEAKALKGEDFTNADTASKAERAVEAINVNDHGVVQEAKKIYNLIMASYPAADYDPLGGTGKDILNKHLKDKNHKSVDYRDASYAFNTKLEPEASTCSGEVIGLPKISLGLNGCGLACDQTLSPQKCVAFGHYQVDGTEDLCFLFSKVQNIEVFIPEAAMLQQQLKKTKAGAPASARCKIKMSELATGYKPKGMLMTREHCFGACTGFKPRILTEVYPIPSKVEIQGKEVIPKLA